MVSQSLKSASAAGRSVLTMHAVDLVRPDGSRKELDLFFSRRSASTFAAAFNRGRRNKGRAELRTVAYPLAGLETCDTPAAAFAGPAPRIPAASLCTRRPSARWTVAALSKGGAQ